MDTLLGNTMLKKLALAISLCIFTLPSYSRGFDIKLANEVAEFTYLTESSTFGYGGADIGYGILFTEADDYQFSGELLISGNPAGNNKAFQFGIGGKILLTSIDSLNEVVGTIGITGQARYIIPSSTPIAFVAGVTYAPSITSFSGADGFSGYNVAFELEVTPSARAYLGYENMEYDFNTGGKFEIADTAHIGVKFEF